jgi:transcriptional regulator with XRE-family HTH domain
LAGGTEDLGTFIRAQRQERKLSLRRLSEASGISNPYLSQIERGLRRPSAHVLQHIAAALNMPIEPLYVRAGMLSAERGDLETRIRAEPGLTAEQRDALVALYRQFRDASPDGKGSTPG